jgi:hypothetical protein
LLRLPEGCREPANGFAPLAASAVRGADPKIYLACFPILLRASPPYRSVGIFFHLQEVNPSGSGHFRPLDDLKLPLATESHKRNLWKFSTARRIACGQRWISFSAGANP